MSFYLRLEIHKSFYSVLSLNILEEFMEKKNLLKCALAAFAVVSVVPASADTDPLEKAAEQAGTLLAKSCGGGSCGAPRGNVSYNDNAPRYYQTERPAAHYCGGAPRGNVTYSPSQNNPYEARNPNQSANYYNYAADPNEQVQSMQMSQSSQAGTISEADLNRQLSSQGKAIYQSLDSEGKTLARQLASQDSYRDKDLAVKEAQRRVNEKRGFSGSSMSTDSDRSSNWNR